MATRREALKQAGIINREVIQVERQTVNGVRACLLNLQQQARGAVRRGEFITSVKFPQKCHESMRLMLQVQTLQGKRRVQLFLPKGRDISLALFGDIIQKLRQVVGRLTRVELDQINGSVQTVFDELNARLKDKLLPTLAELVTQGTNVRDSVKQIDDLFFRFGVHPRNSFEVENIFRTYSQMQYNRAKWQAEQDPAVQEILWGYRYVTVGDDRVRDEHAAVDNVVLPKGDAFWKSWYPPNGWSCRCAVIPLFEPEEGRQAPVGVQPDEGFQFNPGTAPQLNVAV